MLATQSSLASLQLKRNSIAEVAESPTPLREAALEGFRRRNAALDAVFYDVGKVTTEEAAMVSPWMAREGAILIVPPTDTGPLTLCRDNDEFAAKGGADVRALAVAGVGSSALGSAAFARNVADAFGEPVAAVVSGYGLADLASEALGGWFWFGTLNSVRHEFERWDDFARSLHFSPSELRTTASPAAGRLSLDTRTVCGLLSDPRFEFSLLTGHSKGNLVISEALFNLEASGIRVNAATWLVTVSAVIRMPSRYRNIVDVIGGIDWLGALNSRPDIGVEKKPAFSWHHTNTELWFHLPVTRVFGDLIEERGLRLTH